ncbi:MAG TPA: glutathione S-transferase N-terminal domain-containing protein, partial [Phenylobacterium sp.]
MRLYTNQRNSAGERVRIALNLKDVAYDYVSVPRLPPGAYASVNPQGLMPALEVDGQVIAQSAAILAFVDERWSQPPLLPADPILRAQARAF